MRPVPASPGSAASLLLRLTLQKNCKAETCVALQIWKGKSHFHSWHSRIGFITVFFSLAAASGGVLSFRKLGFLTKLPDRWQGPVKTGHRYVRPTKICTPTVRQQCRACTPCLPESGKQSIACVQVEVQTYHQAIDVLDSVLATFGGSLDSNLRVWSLGLTTFCVFCPTSWLVQSSLRDCSWAW